MSDLASWLLEQVAEDERVASTAIEQRNRDIARGAFNPGGEPKPDDRTVMSWDDWRGGPGIRMGAERLLADCDAKRRIIDLAFKCEAKIDGEWGCCHKPAEIRNGDCPQTPVNEIEMLRVLALPYADRPGYREEWRP